MLEGQCQEIFDLNCLAQNKEHGFKIVLQAFSFSHSQQRHRHEFSKCIEIIFYLFLKHFFLSFNGKKLPVHVNDTVKA